MLLVKTINVTIKRKLRGQGLCYLTPLSTIFQLYRDSQFYCWTAPEMDGRPVAKCD